ncbi:uncharacterized protein LOC132267307 [Cornus florida]|uniref:uncharacterized protein LOC132267307 n=1 Tax=Cornus florida TaxID=4283 RepID=UPI002897A2E8|nr:uncharacterized protein LOC132267307 [Cornus florida]
MNPFCARAIFIFSSRSVFINSTNNVEIIQHGLRISHFSTTSSPFHSSSSSFYPSRRQEEESRNVRVSVWWDFENCTVPAGVNVFKVAQSITAAIRANGMKGPIQITAFGDVVQLSRSNQEALSSTGINLNHIPRGGKNSADRSLLVDLMYWVSQNPPPAHLFIISGDRDFATILHRLRMNNYNILLASPETAPGVLCSAASIMWCWNALVKGENLTGKHFNQPPDGPYNSWYGHYKVPLEDPFSVAEQPAFSRAEELPESGADTRLRPVPKVVVKQIRHILNSYPRGISITDLRSELSKGNVCIDKDLYGYKKFSRFLLSMPQILKLQSGSEGQFSVCGIAPRVPEPVESPPVNATGAVTNKGEPDFTITPKLNGQNSSTAKVVSEKSSQVPYSEVNVKKPPTKVQEQQTKVQEPQTKVQEPQTRVQEPQTKVQELPPLIEKENNAGITERYLHSEEEYCSISELGFFKKIWRKWFGGKGCSSEKKSCSIQEKSSSGGSPASTRAEEIHVKSTSQKSADPVAVASFPSSNNEAEMKEKTDESSESYDYKPRGDPGFFNQMMSWCKFWRSPNSNSSSEQSCENLNQKTIDSGKQEIFLKGSFWNDMQAFFDTPKGLTLILQSRTREQMAQNLQKCGPSALSSLGESDLLHLVDLLISEKNWVEECPSQNYPFKFSSSSGKRSSSGSLYSSNGLRSVISRETSQSSPQRLPQHTGEKRHQNFPYAGINQPVINKKLSDKSRSEILGDCQKLVDYIAEEYPEGFKMGSFRKLFLERYGYSLDLQKLGYQKLATLLQIMPGVKIESSCIFPSGKVSKRRIKETVDANVQENIVNGAVTNFYNELCDASRKDDDLESPWEELGPVANASPKRNGMEMGLSKNVKDVLAGQMHHDYETLSDDDLSDSEDETSSLTGSEGRGRPRENEEDSSLLKILDSWYSSRKESSGKNGSENVDGVMDWSGDGLKPSGASGVGIKTETSVVHCGRKQRPFKNYSFVAEQPEDNKDKLIDGILGSLKKSGESRING